LKKVTIFLASSGDVQAERDMVAQACEDIRNDKFYRRFFDLELLRWDDPKRQVPFLLFESMQESVERQIGKASDCDLLVAIYKHRYGTHLPTDKHGKNDRGLPWTGTEWEVTAAHRGKVPVAVFRNMQPLSLASSLTAEQRADANRQFDAVCNFFESKCHGMCAGGGWVEYDGAASFAAELTNRLRSLISDLLPDEAVLELLGAPALAARAASPVLQAAQRELHAALLIHNTVRDTTLLERVLAEPISSIEAYLLQRYAYWAVQEGPTLHQHFVNLNLVTDRGAGRPGNRFNTEPFTNLPAMLATVSGAHAWLLVGDPGGGKSTLMQHYEMTHAVHTLRRLHEAQAAGAATGTAQERPELVIWQRLAEHRLEAGPGAAANEAEVEPERGTWLARRWYERYADLPPLAELQKRFRVRWLLDGLNEIQRADDKARQQAQEAWGDWLQQPGALGPGSPLPPIFSVRRRDLTVSLGEHTRQASVAAWTAEQQQAYCRQRLGPNNSLWIEIEKDAALRELSGNPFQLDAQCELFAALRRPAAHRAELMSGLAWLRLRHAHARDELKFDGLLGREDKLELSDDSKWMQPTCLLRLPDEGVLIRTLDQVALAMHQASGGTALSVPCTQVATALPAGPNDLREAWLRAAERLHLAEAGREFRFAHHLWQEFFAARGMAQQGPGPQWASALQAPALKQLEDVVAALGALDPLPGPGTTPWEETFKMAVLLSPHAAAWIEALMPVNLALAGRAAAALPVGWSTQLLGQLKRALLARSRDAAVDVRLRIEAGEALGLLGDDLRYDVIRSTAGVQVRLPNAEHWVAVPAGAYRIGSEREDKDSEGDEYPVTPVNLEAFEMAFAPVTNAEFECFMRAGGYDDERWWAWQGEEALTWLETGLRNQGAEDLVRQVRDAFASDWNEALRRWPNIANSPATLEQVRGWLKLSESQFIATLESNFGAAAPNGRPRFWDDSNFNHKLQPVVGVCCYEARAYAQWLTRQVADGHTYFIPTEAQWEAAARGVTRSLWPNGHGEPQDAWALNVEPAHLRRSSPVGCFSHSHRIGASVLGAPVAVVDLSGNVLEWCSNAHAPYVEGHFNQPSTGGASLGRAVRGGSWSYHAAQARPAYRGRGRPINRDGGLGFRLVRCPIQNTEH
jgi:formylglycine-generating enzyme required for sulfatase activity